MSTAPKRIEVPAFPGGKRICVTTSWDDGRVYDRWVVAAFNKLGIKGTFNLNSSILGRTGELPTDESGGYMDASEIAELFAGHAVAVHSATHPFLERLDSSQIITEIMDDRKALEELVGYPVRGMAYPFGTYNQQVITLLRDMGIVYSRTTGAGVTSFPPAEPLAWSSTLHAIRQTPNLQETWDNFYGNPHAGGVFYVWAHSYEYAKDRSEIERSFAPLAGKPDVWYSTDIELYDYEDARKRLIIAANRKSVYNPSALTVTVSLDGTLCDAAPGLTRF